MQPLQALLAVPESRSQLVAPRVAEARVLLGVHPLRFVEDAPHLGLQVRIRAVALTAGVGVQLGPVERDHPDPHQTSLGAQPEHLGEQSRERLLVLLAETADRRVVGVLVRGQHPEGDVLPAAPFDLAARALALAVGVEHERDHHRRLVRLPPPTVLAVALVERGEVQLADRIEHEPREVVPGQPVAEAGGHQVLLVTVARQETLGHGGTSESLRPRRHAHRIAMSPSSWVCATASATAATSSLALDGSGSRRF